MMAIDRKLLRDLWRTRAQVASIALVLAGGVLAVVSIRGTASSLVLARDEYYADAHFADVFATLTRAPDEIQARLEVLPGVAQVQTRVVCVDPRRQWSQAPAISRYRSRRRSR